MNLCLNCFSLGYCRNQITPAVTGAEMRNRAFLQDGRNAGYDWAVANDVSFASFPEELVEALELSGRTISVPKSTGPIDLDVLVRPKGMTQQQWDMDGFTFGEETRDDDAVLVPEYRFYYGRNFMQRCGPNPYNTHPERMRVVLSILKCLDPVKASSWGRRTANDN